MHPMNNAVGLSGRPLFSLLFAAVLVIVITFQPASAFLPLQCVSNVTKPHAICCPRHPTNGKVCGGSKMGSCDRIIAPIEYVPTVFHVDDRAAWPTRFFSYACQCRGNFFGPACETCWFGWKGRLCDQRHMLTRKDIRRLSDFELKVFIDVVSRSRTWPSGYAILDESDNWHSDPLNNPNFEEASIQYFITFNHRYGSRTTLYKNVEDCEMYGILDFNHDGLTFPTWHRYFLLIWERMLGQIANKVYGITDFALPYWDWIGMRECDICNNRYIGAPGRRDSMGLHISERHPFHNMTEFCYEPEDGMLCYGCQKAQTVGKIVREWNSLDFPTQDNFEFTMSRRQ
ncbi:unnamed protein product [Protopolystoma xenopodis]|uniref:Tyrosinase copper-binding domain-containing protein n=1 Tax=Protopolystoma xenopodis TaxID=117903 RepID=A0A3S5CT06_9PLAT|nr:unnamed protein product [Protopolystoma xenopodis]